MKWTEYLLQGGLEYTLDQLFEYRLVSKRFINRCWVFTYKGSVGTITHVTHAEWKEFAYYGLGSTDEERDRRIHNITVNHLRCQLKHIIRDKVNGMD